MKVAALLMAAGRGERMGAGQPKCFLPLAGRPLFLHALATFARTEPVPRLVLVVPPGWEEEARRGCASVPLPHPPLVVAGGEERDASVRAGLALLAENPPDLVAVHDAARPLVTRGLIETTYRAAAEVGAAVAATPLTDTLKRAAEDLLVSATPSRADLWRAQTPQTFRYELLCMAHAHAQEQGLPATDDAMLVEALGHPVRLCPASAYNLKVTTAEDLQFVERWLLGGGEQRVGHGYDLHRLVEGRPLILGGVQIPYDRGLLGHSDGDAVCHALADALLGAAALGDIGAHFPDTDPQYAGADSLVLLRQVVELLTAAGLRVVNCDLTVQAQAPKLRPYVEAMRAKLAESLGVERGRVSLKATTMEGLGPIGEGQALAVHAVAVVATSAGL